MDGSQHYEESHQQRDMQRDLELMQMGCKVLRYSNADINLRFQSVCDDIWNHINKETEL